MTLQSARDFLDAVTGYTDTSADSDTPSQDKPLRIATIWSGDGGSGNPRVLFDGESIVGNKGYPWAGRRPRAGERVVLAPVGTSYFIMGVLGDTTTAGSYRAIAGDWTYGAAIAAGASGNVTVTFPVTFSSAPRVFITSGGSAPTSRPTPAVTAVTTTGFTVNWGNWSTGATPSTGFTFCYWAVL